MSDVEIRPEDLSWVVGRLEELDIDPDYVRFDDYKAEMQLVYEWGNEMED